VRRYIALAKCSLMAHGMYRAHFIFTSIGNLFYIALIYYLWRSIYGVQTSMHGLSFNQAFVYLALASTIFNLLPTFVEWDMGYSIIDGNITSVLIKPLDCQLNLFAGKFGMLVFNFLFVVFPAVLTLILVFKVQIPLGMNLVFFVISVLLSFLLSFGIDFTAGLLAFYTQSIWGISTTKNVLVLLLSGVLVPLSFFPDGIRKWVELLPFQAIYHTPLKMLVITGLTPRDYIQSVLYQLGWLAVIILISRLFYRKAIKVVTVSGG
jgi:ABC-2 type transport system permease protein